MSAPHTILIVEDDPGFASYLKRLLRRDDLKLVTASSGRQAIAYLNRHTIDIVLQDIGLPDINGYQVMDQIRQRFPEVLVIVMTGEVTVESAVEALRKGAYDYLRKPFESIDLVNTVENALERLRLKQQNRQAEEKLRESEERYRQLFENESDAMVVFDAETLKLEDANQAAVELFGYSKEQFLKRIILDISAEKQQTEKNVRLLCEDRSSLRQVPLRHLVKKDGSIFATEISTGIFISGGRQKIIGTIRDITIRHRAEEELKTTKQRLQHVLTSSPAVIYACNPAGDCATTFISTNVKTELGHDSEDFVNDPHFWIDHIHPDDIQYVKDVFSKLVDRGSHVLEYRFQHKDGSYRWMRDELRLLFGENGKTVEVVGSWTDISDMKQAEEALRKSEQQFRDLIENSPVGISIVQNGQIVYQNPEQKKIFSLSSDFDMFKFVDYVHPDDTEKVKQAYQRLASEKLNTIEIDFRFYPPDGNGNKPQMKWFQCRVTRFQYQGEDALL